MSRCRICEQPLVIELDTDSFDEAAASSVGEFVTSPDDLRLACGCHFHWSVSELLFRKYFFEHFDLAASS